VNLAAANSSTTTFNNITNIQKGLPRLSQHSKQTLRFGSYHIPSSGETTETPEEGSRYLPQTQCLFLSIVTTSKVLLKDSDITYVQPLSKMYSSRHAVLVSLAFRYQNIASRTNTTTQ
jgi:hypothetical protein